MRRGASSDCTSCQTDDRVWPSWIRFVAANVMRTRRVILIGTVCLVLFLIAGFLIYIEVIEPRTWYPRKRRESVRILRSAQTASELTEAVSHLGLFIPLT